MDIPVTSEDFAMVQREVTIPAGAVYAVIKLYANGGNMNVDDIGLSKLTGERDKAYGFAEEPEPSKSPTETTEPSASPEPTVTTSPSAAPEPSKSPEPSESPNPSESPEPSESPNPSEAPAPVKYSIKYTNENNAEGAVVTSPEAGTCCAVLAAYSGGALTSVEIIEVTFEAAGEKTLTAEKFTSDGADIVKAMLWKSLEDIKPLCAADTEIK